MNLVPQKHETLGEQTRSTDDIGLLGKLTRLSASSLTRRGFMGGALGSAATALGMRLFDTQQVAAQACNYCTSGCNCHPYLYCCSPDQLTCVGGWACADCCSCCTCLSGWYQTSYVCDGGLTAQGCTWEASHR